MRPHQLLPLPLPSEFDPSIKEPDYFYKNFVKPMIKDVIKLMATGINIDQDAVEDLRSTVLNVLDDVNKKLSKNKTIKEFREYQYKIKYKEYLDEMQTKKKAIEEFIKPFKESNIVHRTYLVNTVLENFDLGKYKLDKWTVNDLKKVLILEPNPVLQDIVDKKFDTHYSLISQAMQNLAKDKMIVYNKAHYTDKIDTKTFDDIVPKFNPGSALQLGNLLTDFLKFEPFSLTEGGAPQWNRQNVQTLSYTVEEGDLKEILQCLIDYSYSAIIQDNFINAFDRFIIDDTLHGNIKLFGAKSFRLTSNSPNMLNAPSTGSIYAKSLKKCFIAPDDYIVYAVDLNALEDRVIANLTNDANKIITQVDTELDGHLFHAVVYFRKQFVEMLGDLPHRELAIAAKKAMDEGNKHVKELRQKSKGITFGASYGAYPPKIATSIGCSLKEATDIFNAYHNDMYPGISKTREDTLGKAKEQGYLHLGLGCRIYSDDVEKNSRTLWNACSQFWSIVTLITINEMHYRISKNNLDDDIRIHSTIYDSIYFYVKKDADVVKWLNDNVVEVMTKDFLIDQKVHNECEGEIGINWAELQPIKNNASLDTVKRLLEVYS